MAIAIDIVIAILILKAKGTKNGEIRLFDFSDRTARTYVKKVIKKAGLSGAMATPRGLRHSMGVMLVLNKVPGNTIKDMLGHRAIKNTMIYLQMVDDERRGLVSQIW